MAMEADQAGLVEFKYSDPQATELYLVGSFNGWNPHAHPMHRDGDGYWVRCMRLPAGTYQFHYLARLASGSGWCPDKYAQRVQWSCTALEMVVVTPRGGSFHMGPTRASHGAKERPLVDIDAGQATVEANDAVKDSLLPLSRLEAALIRGFRRLPDHESRSAFLDVVEESVYC